MRTRQFLRLCFGSAAALCVVAGVAGSAALLHSQSVEKDVRAVERVQSAFGATLRAGADLLLSEGSTAARKSAESARQQLDAASNAAESGALAPELQAKLEATRQQLAGLLALKRLAPDNDDALVIYGKLASGGSEALRLLDGTVEALNHRAETSVRAAIGASLVVAALSAALVAGCGMLARRHLERRLGGELEEAQALLARVGSGDLRPIAMPPRRDSVIGVMSEMVQELRRMIGSVRDASNLLSTSSAQIAGGNADLCHRTESTAGRLQQASGSMTQITGSVGQAAASSLAANELALTAASVAERGGEVVQQVVGTMGEIQASSRRIGDIIGVIDSIAFQTNILALNAAVEAARAGEQGRGFAVVASEVRGLAQRSAEAAREIKSLIGSNVERVDQGSRLAGDAGSTMSELVASVSRVSSIIGEITRATGEQSAGIGQVSEAVSELDVMTQQNAALVEESAAAAEDLRRQAARLNEVVAAFRLEAEAAG